VLWITFLYLLLTDFTVGSSDEFDHFPISCELSGAKVTVTDTPPSLVIVQSNPRVRYEWDTAKRDEYRALLVDETSQVQSDEFLSYIERGDINRAASSLIDIVHRAAYAMKCQPLSTRNVNNNKHRPHADWWSAECDAAKFDKQLKLRIYRHTRLQDDLNIYLASKRKFKSICRQRQDQHKIVTYRDLRDSSKCSDKVWSMIKKLTRKRSAIDNAITPENWSNHFSELLNNEPNINSEFEEHVINFISQHDDACEPCISN